MRPRVDRPRHARARRLLPALLVLLGLPQAAAQASGAGPAALAWLRPVLLVILVASLAVAGWTGSQLMERERQGKAQPDPDQTP